MAKKTAAKDFLVGRTATRVDPRPGETHLTTTDGYRWTNTDGDARWDLHAPEGRGYPATVLDGYGEFTLYVGIDEAPIKCRTLKVAMDRAEAWARANWERVRQRNMTGVHTWTDKAA